jgi:hypothetical protein
VSAEYRVTWEVDVEASTAVAAAKEVAAEYFQARISAGEPGTACVFYVTGPDGVTHVVALDDLRGGRQ